jgi:EmrB/QacA subfamily drug resistance transporter
MAKYLIFGVVILTILIQSMSGSAVAVAFPQITTSFNVSVALAGWVLSIYMLATIITLPLSGKASDALGRKRTFMFFVLLFTVGSFLCAIAPNIYWLILFRVIQGAGGGGFMTSATGIMADTFPQSRQRMIGLLVSTVSVAWILGPNVGGWLTESFGWRSIFWFAIPMGIVAVVSGVALMKPDAKMRAVQLDIKGAGILAISLGTFMSGLTTIGDRTSTSSWALAIGLIVLGAALMIIFLRHERGARNPIIDLVVLRGRPFMAANVYNIIFGFDMGVLTLLPLYAVTVHGASTIESGLIVTPRAVGMLASSIVSSLVLVRWGYRKPMIVGVSLIIAACLVFALESQRASTAGILLGGIAVTLIAITISGLGHGISSPAANNACIELMPGRVSTITGVRITGRHVGQALGIAIASVVLDSFGSLARGFEFVFFGTALVSLITIPCAFAMPRSPSDVPSERAGNRPTS